MPAGASGRFPAQGGRGMRQSLPTEFAVSLAVLARVSLGLVFLAAGLAKVVDSSTFAKFLRSWRANPGWIEGMIARVLPMLEVGTGALLLTGFRARLVGLFATSLLLFFTALVLLVIRRGTSVSCGCFGQLDKRPVSVRTVHRNLLLAAVGLTVVVASPTALGVEDLGHVTSRPNSGDLLALIGIEVAVVLVVIAASAGFWLRARSLQPPMPREMGELGPAWYGVTYSGEDLRRAHSRRGARPRKGDLKGGS